MALCIELAHPGDDVAGQTDTDDLHDSLEDQQGEIGEVGVRAVRLLLEGLEEAIVAVVERLRGHGDKMVGAGSEVAQAQGLGTREERHPSAAGSGVQLAGALWVRVFG